MPSRILIVFSCITFVFVVACSWLFAQDESANEARIQGRLVSESNSPLAGAHITVSGPTGQERQTCSDKDGRFEFRLDPEFSRIAYDPKKMEPTLLETMRSVLPGLVSVRFTPYSPDKSATTASTFRLEYGAGYSMRRELSVILAPGQVHDCGDIVFGRRGITVGGRVVNQDGRAVCGASVVLYVDMGLHLGIATSDNQGSFCLRAPDWCESERPSTLKVFLPDKRTLVPFEFSDWKAWNTQKVELQVPESPASLQGKVEARGAPVGDAQVLLYKDGQQSTTTFYPIARTASDGVFCFSNIPPGRYSVHVVSERNGRTAAMLEAPGNNVLIQYPEAEPGSLRGNIRIAFEGIPNVPVPARDRRSRDGLFMCDETGHPMRPLLPIALVEVSQDYKLISFTANGVNPGKIRLQLLPCANDGPTMDMLDRKESEFSGWGILSMHEPWRPLPQAPFLIPVSERLNAEIAEILAGKSTQLDFEIVFSYEDFKRLTVESMTGRR